ncbi:MAG TPA: hypothetical protein DDZ42_21270 [Candidatus Rokubacteria bacterium]|nr:MAG: hypothetical protein A2050_06765 [Candidatus Rokubacteria bacterium GWA2_73_35]HBH04408.1 hypothetical protein [Candidatus Rokubacteria bacterium]
MTLVVLGLTAFCNSGASDGRLTSAQPGPITCALDPGGVRYQRPCEAQFASSAANIKAKASVLQKVGVELGLSRDKIAEVADKTLNSVAWLRDLCADWNACAISQDAYQERKTRLVAIEDNFYSLARQAEKLRQAGTTKSVSDPAVRDLEARFAVHVAEASRLAPAR